MEQINKRYIEIQTCLKCGHNGHIADTDKNNVVFICSNPINMSLDVPKKFIGKSAYPIISIELTNVLHVCPIPSWCKLPNEVYIKKR
jgi:hypothetical protein